MGAGTTCWNPHMPPAAFGGCHALLHAGKFLSAIINFVLYISARIELQNDPIAEHVLATFRAPEEQC